MVNVLNHLVSLLYSIVDSPPQTDLWTTKYRPAQVKDLCGNKAQIQKLTRWLENWYVPRGFFSNETMDKKRIVVNYGGFYKL
jgi:hypothetical protein